MYAAYDSLPEATKARIDGARALHSSRHVFGAGAGHLTDAENNDQGDRYGNPEAATQDVWHKMVIRHPISGRKALYVNPDFTVRIDGLPEDESRELLDEIFAHAQRPEHIYRFEWEPGSIAFWDNRASAKRLSRPPAPDAPHHAGGGGAGGVKTAKTTRSSSHPH